jgi:prepilin-type N-terminal cleavage/methylation domain-containing protein
MPGAKRGFTLIEILVATAVAVLIMGAITSVFYYLLVIPPQQTDQLNAENQLRLSLDWIQRDGVQAHSFTPIPPGEKACDTSYSDSDYYGYFSSYTSASCANPGCPEIRIAYRYDNANERLVREKAKWETDGCGTINTTTIAFNIVDMGNVTFTPLEGDNNTLTVNMTVTLNPDSQNKVRKTISITDTRYIEMRAEP